MPALLSPGYSYGAVVRRRTVPGFTLKEVVYPLGLKVPEHAHEQATVYLVLHGAYTEVYGTHSLTPESLGVAFHPANIVHWHHCHGVDGRCFTLEVAPSWIERVLDYTRLPDDPTSLRSALAVSLALRLYREFQEEDGAAALAMEGLAIEILAEASRHPTGITEHRPPRWLKRVDELLHARFAETLTLDEIAREVGVHPGHLASVFRRFHHCTIGECLRQMRIEFVCRELARSDTPLADLAVAAGFADQSHLTRTFKRLTGTTPARFRVFVRSP